MPTLTRLRQEERIMKNKIVTLLCIITILITTAVVALGGNRQTMAISENTDRLFEIDQMVDGRVVDESTNVELLYPMVGDVSKAQTETRYINGDGYSFATNANIKDRVVTAKNVAKAGTSGEPVFVRTLFAFESGGLTLEGFHKFMHININASKGDYTSQWTWLDNDQWVSVKVGTEEYYVTTATYKTQLNANETTEPSLLQIGLLSGVSSDTADKFGNDGFKFIIKTQAVQATGAENESFEEIASRLNGAFGEISESNNTWIDNVFKEN